MKRIRELAQEGDWILGTVGRELASKNEPMVHTSTFRRVVYLARVTEPSLPFEQYWKDGRFKEQKDRVYRPVSGGRYNGFESVSWNPHCEPKQKCNDTECAHALISEHFYYFGRESRTLDSKWKKFVSGQSKRWRLKYKSFKSEDIDEFIEFVEREWKQYKNVWKEPTSPWQSRCRC